MKKTEKTINERRVLLIAPQPFYEERGTPMNVRLMCTILGKAGYQVDLLAFPTGSDLPMEGVRLIRLPNILFTGKIPIGFSLKKLIFDLLLPFWGLWLCLRNRYAVIHGVEEGGVVAVLLARFFKGAGSIFDMDSVMSDQFGGGADGGKSSLQRVIHAFEVWSIRNASVIITVCSALTEAADKAEPDGPVVQIEDIPLSFAFPSKDKDVAEIRSRVNRIVAEYGLVGKKIVLYTGNLQSYQGIDLLLEAWGLSRQSSQSDTECLVIIGGPKELVDTYTGLLQDKPWKGTVVFIGPRPSEEMDEWMECAACLASPRSQGENTPLKIYSYMAAKKPIIATRMKTHTQVLDDESAFLVRPDAKEMAQKIAHVYSNPLEAMQKAENAYQVVRQEYSYDIFSEKLLLAYDKASVNPN